MREEHQEKLIRDAEKLAQQESSGKKTDTPRKPMGFIAVSIGEGINSIFRELGTDCIIEGGQTMNPSTEDMLKAIDEVNADTVFIPGEGACGRQGSCSYSHKNCSAGNHSYH